MARALKLFLFGMEHTHAARYSPAPISIKHLLEHGKKADNMVGTSYTSPSLTSDLPKSFYQDVEKSNELFSDRG